MGERVRITDRRNSIRVKMFCPAVCTRFDNGGRTCELVPSTAMDISSRGVKLKYGFIVTPGEILEITMALGPNMVTFRGRVVHMKPAEDQSFELGTRIEEIQNQDRIALTRFVIQKYREMRFEDTVFHN